MKKCPYCAEEIQGDAIKCKHCGEWLNKEPNAVTQTQKEIRDNVLPKKPIISETSIMGTILKTEVTEKQFTRFKILTILGYVILISCYLLMALKGTEYEDPLTMIWAVCLFAVGITFWVYLVKCVAIVQKRTLYYIALCMFVPFVGAAWAYTRLRSHYDNPSPEKW